MAFVDLAADGGDPLGLEAAVLCDGAAAPGFGAEELGLEGLIALDDHAEVGLELEAGAAGLCRAEVLEGAEEQDGECG